VLQQHVQPASQQHVQTPSQPLSTPQKATSTLPTNPAQIEDTSSAPIRCSSCSTSDIDYRKLNNPAARLTKGPRFPLPVQEEEETERTEYAFLVEGILEAILEAIGMPCTYNEALNVHAL
jgi:hypothetical protein